MIFLDIHVEVEDMLYPVGYCRTYKDISVDSLLPDCVFTGCSGLQTWQRRSTSVWWSLDLFPQVSPQLFRPRGLPLLLQWNSYV